MARKIKVYVTLTNLYGEMAEKNREFGMNSHSSQVRIICGATSMAEANRMCEAVGLDVRGGIFRSDYTTITGNPVECELAGNGGIFIATSSLPCGRKEEYHSIGELKGGER